MFNLDFYPTPREVIETMLSCLDVSGKVILEPSAGKGDIVDYLKEAGAKEVIACELEPALRKTLHGKCNLIGTDFLQLQGHEVSHIDMIIMNPPFSQGDKHIMHAWDIAPAGCDIVALCNLSTVKNQYSKTRETLSKVIEENGSFQDLGKAFAQSERFTMVEVALVRLKKPGENKESEFEGFFMDEDPEEQQENGIMSYNVVRDLVNRYVAAVRLYDDQLATGIKMNSLLSGFYGSELAFTCTEKGAPVERNNFKKALQKAGWKFIFEKMNMQKYATRGLKEDINKFVEQQTHIPFTMQNIYRMLDIVVGTQSARMDKAILEVFDKLTQHTEDNRYFVEGWKTNSHYLIARKFIIPRICYQDQRCNKGSNIEVQWGGNVQLLDDLVKALCYITGENYEKFGDFCSHVRYPFRVYYDNTVAYFDDDSHFAGALDRVQKLKDQGIDYKYESFRPAYGECFDWAFFRVRCFKKGTAHFEFLDEDLWGKLNQRIAKLKGYALYEGRKQSAYQQRNTGRSESKQRASEEGARVVDMTGQHPEEFQEVDNTLFK